MKRIYFLLTTLFLAFFIINKTQAQNERRAQFTFFYPIGSSGHNSIDYSYKFSFNTIYGINGGVNGFELGSVGNVVKGSVNGFQLAGVFNLTTQNSSGGIISGVINSSKAMEGLSLSGVANIAREEANGAIISGVINQSKTIKGLQLSTINIASEQLNGAQIGVVNFTKKGKGFQLGVVNVGENDGDSILPLGVINIYKNGYYALELSTDEKLFTNVSYKMGVEKLYTIFRMGIGFRNSTQFYSLGGGLGTFFNIGAKNKINLEVLSIQFFENDFKYIDDILSQVNLSYQYEITDRLALKFGPTFNCFIEDKNKTKKNDAFRVPYSIVEAKSDNHITSLWIGANAGLVIKL
ncbi:LA_2272 family surface repeat-containing protein [Maribellus maritimus]|uniref:LA_2272 family surface repeat-containing protein n=1 Tax=Maribellus maritimus TaxID=2870838 RepID=UPI001EEC5B7B|nr:hypothetical protein [Maribellus maritimus]MCG6191019.1 hypothetical protein [Maribellus maritimus]